MLRALQPPRAWWFLRSAETTPVIKNNRQYSRLKNNLRGRWATKGAEGDRGREREGLFDCKWSNLHIYSNFPSCVGKAVRRGIRIQKIPRMCQRHEQKNLVRLYFHFQVSIQLFYMRILFVMWLKSWWTIIIQRSQFSRLRLYFRYLLSQFQCKCFWSSFY